jgi:actin-related protein
MNLADGIIDKIHKNIQNNSKNIDNLCSNIIVVGGTSKMSGILERIEFDIKNRMPNTKFNFIIDNEHDPIYLSLITAEKYINYFSTSFKTINDFNIINQSNNIINQSNTQLITGAIAVFAIGAFTLFL